MMKSVSVAVATYNGEKYLAEQLRSIVSQKRRPDEIILSDDGSTDRTMDIVQEFVKDNPSFSIRVNRNVENLHFAGNFLKAASLCTGDFIAFADQDDIWYPEKLERVLDEAQRTQAELTIHQARVVDANGRPTREPFRPPMGQDINQSNLSGNYAKFTLGCCFLVRRSAIDDILAMWDWDEHIKFRSKFGFLVGHDLLIFALCFGRKSVGVITEPLMDYRVHDSNATAVNFVSKTPLERIAFRLGNLTVRPTSYRRPAMKWNAEASYLDAILRKPVKESVNGLVELSIILKTRAKAWLLRGDIVDLSLPLSRRISACWIIARGGFYTRNRAGLDLSRMSMIKDILYIFLTMMPFRKNKGS